MKKKFNKHLTYYFSLIGLESIGFVLVIINSQNKPLQTVFIMSMGLVYALWAIMHHHIHHNLTRKIVVEYILVGVLGVTLSTFIF